MALFNLARFSESRIQRYINGRTSKLPDFLVKFGGLNSGLMISQCKWIIKYRHFSFTFVWVQGFSKTSFSRFNFNFSQSIRSCINGRICCKKSKTYLLKCILHSRNWTSMRFTSYWLNKSSTFLKFEQYKVKDKITNFFHANR